MTCRTCPYQFTLDKTYFDRVYMKKKQKDDIMGEDESELPVIEGTTTYTGFGDGLEHFWMLTSDSSGWLSE